MKTSRLRFEYGGALQEIGILLAAFGSLSSFFETGYGGMKLLALVLVWIGFGTLFFHAGLLVKGGK